MKPQKIFYRNFQKTSTKNTCNHSNDTQVTARFNSCARSVRYSCFSCILEINHIINLFRMTLSVYHIPYILITFISLHIFHMPHSLTHACMTCMSFHQSIRQDYKLERSVSATVVTKTPDGIQLPEKYK
jgi:hypothetical protein